jgi:hypothetical protein
MTRKTLPNAIISGEQPPTLTGLYRNAAPVRAELARQHFNLQQAESDWKAVQKHLTTLNGAQQERLTPICELRLRLPRPDRQSLWAVEEIGRSERIQDHQQSESGSFSSTSLAKQEL